MTNEVEEFLKSYPNTIYSIGTLSKRLNIRKKHVYYLYKISNHVEKANPLSIGSKKHRFNIFKYVE